MHIQGSPRHPEGVARGGEGLEAPADQPFLIAGGDDDVNGVQSADRRRSGHWSGSACTTISTSRSR